MGRIKQDNSGLAAIIKGQREYIRTLEEKIAELDELIESLNNQLDSIMG